MAEPTSVAQEAGRRPPLWQFDVRWMKRLLVAWAVVLAGAQLLRRGPGLPHPLIAIESVVYLVVMAILLSFVPVRTWLLAIPTPHRRVVGGFFFLIVLGQLTLNSRRTYPFPSWTMYGRPEPKQTVEYYRYRGLDGSGKEVWLNPVRVFPFVNSAEIASRVKAFGRATEAQKPEKREAAMRKVHDWLVALGTAYNDDHPDATLRSLEFVRYRWEYKGETSPEDLAGQPLLRVDLAERSAR
jgi:hypothetical protein